MDKFIGLERGGFGILLVDKTGKLPPNFARVFFHYGESENWAKDFQEKSCLASSYDTIITNVTIRINRLIERG